MIHIKIARLAQLVERKALNLVVVGLSPTVGGMYFFFVKIVLNISTNIPFCLLKFSC